MSEISALDKHACPACGAEAVWDASRQMLRCPYCGMNDPWNVSENGATVSELDLAAALRAIPDGQRGWEADRVSVQCQSCKAISLFRPEQVANRCEFCGSPAVVPYEATRNPIYPGSLLPFKVAESKVREQMRQWYRSRWFAPNRLRRAALTDQVHGVYIPFWTFDAQVHADWTAESGHYYYVTESYRDRDGRTATRQVRKIRWESSAGSLDHFFDDELVPATVALDGALLEKISDFPTGDLVPYDRGYVSGWVVEQYQIDLVAAAAHSREVMDQRLRTLCASDVPGDTHRNLDVQASYDGQTFKHILAPVWLLSYDYGRTKYQVLVNGYTGAIAGRHPLSWIKIALAVLAVLLALLMLAGILGNS